MSKLWHIALAFGDNEKTSLITSTFIAPTSAMAVAMTVSQFYIDNPGVRLPLRMVASHEITREYLDRAIEVMDEADAKQPSVVQLVPRPEVTVPLPRIGPDGTMLPTAWEDLHPAEREVLRQAMQQPADPSDEPAA